MPREHKWAAVFVAVLVAFGTVVRTAYLCEGVCLLCSAFCLTGGVTQCKDDGFFMEGSHVLNDLLSESSWHCSHACGTNTMSDCKVHHNLDYSKYARDIQLICIFEGG